MSAAAELPVTTVDTSSSAFSSVGVIVPPEKIMRIIHQTASFVAKSGRHIEEDILNKATQSTANSFTFLLGESPFHAYYLKTVADIQAGRLPAGISPPAAAPAAASAAATAAAAQPRVITKAPVVRTLGLAEAIKAASKRKGEPARELDFLLSRPADASPLQIEIIKLTAQRVAIEGKRFESDLQHREQTSGAGQLGFLFEGHAHHAFFSLLLQCYKKIVGRDSQPYGAGAFVQTLSANPMSMLDRVLHRVNHRREEKAKANPEQARELERQQFLEINWHDFVVVETISIEASGPGALPPGAAALPATASSEVPESAPLPAAAPAAPEREREDASQVAAALRAAVVDDAEDSINLRVGYTAAPVRATLNVPMMTLPDGRRIPVTEVNQHMKAELQDSRWRETQDKFEAKNKTTNTEHGAQIFQNLARMAGARPDVFGGEEEAALRRAEEMKKREREKIVWDGNAFTADAAKAAVQLRASMELAAHAKPVLYSAQQPPAPAPLLPGASSAPLPLMPLPPGMPPQLPPPPPTQGLGPAAPPSLLSAPAALLPPGVQPLLAPPGAAPRLPDAPAPPPPHGAKRPRLEVVEGLATPGAVQLNVPAGGPNGIQAALLDFAIPDAGMEVAALKDLVSKALSNVAVGRFQFMDPSGRFLKNTDVVPKTCAALEVKWKVK